MYFILTASKDTYVTNKVINNAFSASDANVGRASTLDLFRLYNESTLPSGSGVMSTGVPNNINELSRLMIKFNYEKITSLMNNTLDLNSSDFQCHLKLYDVMGGQATPSDFTVMAFPLSQSFDEGIGKNIVSFSDLGCTNFITASYSNSTVYPWYMSGANQEGIIDLTVSTPVAATADQFTFSGIATEDGVITLISYDNGTSFTTKTYIAKAGSTTGTEQSDGTIAFDSGVDADASAAQLEIAIDGVTGHNGKIGTTLAGASLTLAQTVAGVEGNTKIKTSAGFNDSCSTNPPARFTGGTSKYPANIDYIVSGNLNDGNGMTGLGVAQQFVEGSENLSMNITTIVSATVAGILPDCGLRISFTGSQEQDNKTRFVKRFASRHVSNFNLRPRIEVSYNDSLIDNHKNFYFDLSGSLFLKNFHRGIPANILSGSSLTEVTGTDCILVTLRSGSWSQAISASQMQAGTMMNDTNKGGVVETYNYVTGVYSASFAISSSDSRVVDFSTSLADMVSRTGSITFDEYWSSADGLTGYYTGSITVDRIPRYAFNVNPRRLELIVTNAKSEYTFGTKALFRVFVRDFEETQKVSRLPYSLNSVILEKVYYRIRDTVDNTIVVPFKTTNEGTRLSSDSGGMFFETYVDFAKGRTYTIDFLIQEAGIEIIEEGKNVNFSIR